MCRFSKGEIEGGLIFPPFFYIKGEKYEKKEKRDNKMGTRGLGR
jgi:hypothetical protein